jgi:FMN-dependent NADH-azoreductase
VVTLLRIESSARVTRSLSRDLSKHFFETWQSERPNDQVITRDIGLNPPPAVSEDWIAGVFGDEEMLTRVQLEAVTLSDILIGELVQSEIIVITTPMYNYGMPASLKAWFDQVIRINKTFSFDLARGDKPIEPIQSGKTLVILSASGEGGFLQDGLNVTRNHLHPHIVECCILLGVERHHCVTIEYQEFRDERHSESVRSAHASIARLVATITKEL